MKQLSPEALIHLAQYQPCRDNGNIRDSTFAQMVPAVLMESGGALGGRNELRQAFLDLFGVEIEDREVATWLEQLESRGAVERTPAEITVSKKTRIALNSRRSEFEKLTDTASDEWRASLLVLSPTLRDEDLDLLWGDLDNLIGAVVAFHGAEAAVLLYPEEHRSSVLRDTLEQQVDVLPDRGAQLNELRREALSEFFSAPTESQRRFLADRLDHGFFATVGTLRPSAATLMRDELAGQRLYLDTNVLIPALGSAGQRVSRPARRLLELTRGLGVELAVTSRTLEEYRNSLRIQRRELERNQPDRDFAEPLKNEARRIGGVSLAEGYFESYQLNGTSIDDWFRKADVVEPRLEELGISLIDDELSSVFEHDDELVDDYVELLSNTAAKWRKRRDELPLKHDAVHRVLIERLRRNAPENFLAAKYWFLTEDKLLTRFGYLATAGQRPPEIPFCMSASAWAQIARCFTPRTSDYDQMVTDLLASPYVSFGRTRKFSDVQQIVVRITSLLSDASPAVVAAFVGDEVLEAVARAPDQAEKDQVMVSAYEQKKDEMGENIEALTARVEKMHARLAASKAGAKDADRLRERLKQTENLLLEEKAAFARDRTLSEREIRAQKEGRKVAETEAAEERRRRQKLQKSVGTGTAVTGALGLVVLRMLDVLSMTAVFIGGGLILALGCLPLIENSTWARRIAYALAVTGVLLGLLDL